MLVGPQAELFLDRVQFRVEQGIFARQLEHSRLQQQVRDAPLLARPLGGLVVLPPPVPVGVVLARVRYELALLARAQHITVGRVQILGQVYHRFSAGPLTFLFFFFVEVMFNDDAGLGRLWLAPVAAELLLFVWGHCCWAATGDDLELTTDRY